MDILRSDDRDAQWREAYEGLQTEAKTLADNLTQSKQAADQAARQLTDAQNRLVLAEKNVQAARAESGEALKREEAARQQAQEAAHQIKRTEAAAQAAQVQAKTSEQRAQSAQEQAKAAAEAESRAKAAREKAQREAERARAQAGELQAKIDASTDQRRAPLRPVALMFLTLVFVGGLSGFALSKLTGKGSATERQHLITSARSEDVKRGGYVVKVRDIQAFLQDVGMANAPEFAEFSKRSPDERATGVSWLMAMSFCQWLTQIATLEENKFFDLPDYKYLEQLGEDETEWTRDEVDLADKSAPREKGARRPMRIFDKAKAGHSAARTETPGSVSFRCVLRP